MPWRVPAHHRRVQRGRGGRYGHSGRDEAAIQWYEEEDPMYRHAGMDIYLDPAVAGDGLGRLIRG
jgi:hypothetical protein